MAKISDLTPDKANANKGTPRGLKALDTSLRQYGAGRSILLDRDNRIIAGNKTAERAMDIGLDDVQIVDSDGTKLIAVRRTDLDLEDDGGKARALATYDNRVGQLDLDWDIDALGAIDADVLGDLWSDKELADLGVNLGEPPEDPGAQIDKADELRQKWGVETGQLWKLGEHRLICGDCTDRGVVNAVMGGENPAMIWSDPPYGLGGYAGRSGNLESVVGDDASPETIVGFFGEGQAPEIYVCCQWETYPYLLQARGKPRSLIVWAKQVFGMGRGYRRQHEFIGYYGDFDSTTESDLWQIDRGAGYVHPTEKPPALPERAIGNSTQMGDIVFDPFAGTAPSLIACERLGRKCRAVEISPGYVAVAIQRWVDMTGGEPELIDN